MSVCVSLCDAAQLCCLFLLGRPTLPPSAVLAARNKSRMHPHNWFETVYGLLISLSFTYTIANKFRLCVSASRESRLLSPCFCYRNMNQTKHCRREGFQRALSSERVKCWQRGKEVETGGMCTPLPVRRLNCCVPAGTVEFFLAHSLSVLLTFPPCLSPQVFPSQPQRYKLFISPLTSHQNLRFA